MYTKHRTGEASGNSIPSIYKEKNMKNHILTVEKDIRLPDTRIILEKGDKIEVLKKGTHAPTRRRYREASIQGEDIERAIANEIFEDSVDAQYAAEVIANAIKVGIMQNRTLSSSIKNEVIEMVGDYLYSI
jgi:hypothetical protein